MSKITIEFNSRREFEVAISDLEFINPRNLEMAWLAVQKKYLSAKGANVRSIKDAAKAAEDKKAQDAADAVRLAQLTDEEHARTREQAASAASDRLAAEKTGGMGATPQSVSHTAEPKTLKTVKK